MRNGLNGFTTLTIVLLLALNPISQILGQRLRFINYTTQEGLSHNTAYRSFQSHTGEMLITTQNGFNIFNGYEFENFYADPADTLSLSHDNCGYVVEDKFGNIWIGTWGGGLNKIPVNTKQFIHYQHDTTNPQSISDNRIQTLAYDSINHYLWIGTYSGGLNKMDLHTGKVTVYKHNQNDPKSISDNRIWDIHIVDSNTIWVGTNYGLNKFNTTTESFSRYYINPKRKKNVFANRVRAICKMDDETIFIGGQEGLYQFYEKEAKFHFITVQYKWRDSQPLSISDLYEYPKGNLWIGTQRHGLIKYLPQTNDYNQYLHDPIDPFSISGNDIRHINVDQSGVFWIAVRRGGVSTFSLRANKFEHYRYIPDDPNSLTDKQILSIFQDIEKNIWVGTLVGGINKITPSGDFIHYQKSPKTPKKLVNGEVRSIIQSHDSTIWLASDNLLYKYLPEKDSFEEYTPQISSSQSIKDDRIIQLHEDVEKELWLATHLNGLLRFNKQQRTFERFVNTNPQRYANVVNDIANASRTQLWIGTEAGLYLFNKTTQEFEFIEVASKHSITEIQIGQANILWIGTSQGLIKFDSKTQKVKEYTRKNGLPSNQVNSVAIDNDGFLWIGTARGLVKFDPITDTFRKFDVEDGLQGNIFAPKAIHKSLDGQIFIGGQNGFNAFYPNRLKRNNTPPKILLTDFQVMGKSANINKPLHLVEQIDLTHKDVMFSFEFAALDYTSPNKNQYAYRLKNLEDDWIYIGNSRKVRYNHIPSGNYIFQVKASNNDGVWNEKGLSLRVNIHPPFWQTWWFYTLLTLFLIGSTTLVILWRIRQLNRAKLELENQVEIRTTQLRQERDKIKEANVQISQHMEEIEAQRDEIESQREAIGIKNESLQDAIKEIQRQNNEITYQKEEIEKKSTDLEYAQSLIKEQNHKLLIANQALEEKVQQRTGELKDAYHDLLRAHKQLDHFSYRSAHDLKGPIARMLGLCYVAKLEITDKQSLEYFEKLTITAKEMDKLLTRMLRTQEIKNWKISIEPTNLTKLIQEQWEETSNKLQAFDFQFSIEKPKNLPSIEVDPSLIKVLFHNVFENAIQFSKASNPEKKVEVNILHEEEQVIISIQDNGIGVPSKLSNRIFEMFVVGHEQVSGAGVGLYESSIIAERLKGKIWLKDYQEGQTTFELILPTSQENQLENNKSFLIIE